jgi:hypothetical protein
VAAHEAHVQHISVPSMDDFHPRSTLCRRDYLEDLFRARNCDYAFWGATPEMWIGKIWPCGRALETRVSKAGPEDDFCNRWSGALNFLKPEGAEVNIQLAGSLLPHDGAPGRRSAAGDVGIDTGSLP